MRDRQMPAVSDRHEAKTEAQSPSGHRRDAIRKTEHIAGDNDRRAGQRCNGAEIGTQNLRDICEEHVASQAAADAGQHAQKS